MICDSFPNRRARLARQALASTGGIMVPNQDNSLFIDSWWIYQQVLDADYMHHRSLHDRLAMFLRERFSARGISILDLGCGDARHLAGALGGQRVTHYRGVDLSAAALTAARANIAGLSPQETELVQSDLLEAISREDFGFDLVFSGFALHHLTFEQKQRFFLMAAQRLNDTGVLAIMDVARESSEDLPTYLDRYCAWIMSSWIALPPPSREAVCAHVRDNDFPERPEDLSEMALKAGLTRGRELGGKPWHRCWWFERSAEMPAEGQK